MKENLRLLVLGGLAFWTPVVLVSAIGKFDANIIAQNLVSSAGILIFCLISWTATKRRPKWVWALAGVYTLGPAAMIVAASFTHFSPIRHPPGYWLWFMAVCLFPPMTLWLALGSGLIFSVLFVTFVFPLLSLLPRREEVH